jgi:hypothetical protein
MNNNNTAHNIFFRTLFIFAIFILFLTPVWAAKKKATMDIKKLASLKIPNHLGSVDEIWIPTTQGGLQVPLTSQKAEKNEKSPEAAVSPQIVLHIRDAHCIYEAQMHIAQIIENLVNRYGIKLVCVEGSSGKVDTSILAQYTTPSVRQKVLQSFMRIGKVSGPEYASVVFDLPMALYGIENEELYEKNVKAFKTLAPFREKSGRIFELLENQIADIEPHVLSDDLRKITDTLSQYEKGRIQLSRYGADLLANHEQFIGKTDAKDFLEKYPNVALFIQKEKLEKDIDFAKVENERTQFFTDVTAVVSQDELNDMVSKTLEFRLGRLSGLDYYVFLENLLKKTYSGDMLKPDFKFSSFVKFIEYEKLFGSIQTKKLFNEFDDIYEGLTNALAKTPQEKEYIKYSKTIRLLKRLYRSELNQNELSEYLNHKENYQTAGIIQFLQEQSKKYQIRLRDGFRFVNEKQLADLLPAAQDFYTYAEERNHALTDNLLASLEKENVKVTILVAGGFHTEAIKSSLKEKGIAYAVITPNIEKEVVNNPYVDVITDKKTALDKFLLEFKLTGTQEGGISK